MEVPRKTEYNDKNNRDDMENVMVEEYTEKDFAGVVKGIADLQEVERQFTDTRRPGAEIAEAYVTNLLSTLREKSGKIFVARINGDMVGFITAHIERDDNVAETPASTTYGYISDAYVNENYRGKGIFQTLQEQAEKYLKGFSEISRIRINVLAKNEAAVRAYTKAGFSPYEVMLEKEI